MTSQGDRNTGWHRLLFIDQMRLRESLAEWNNITDKEATLRRALAVPHERGTALRLLLILDDETRKCVFGDLIECASVGHADIQLVRATIKTMPRVWVIENIECFVNPILETDPYDDEVFRRFAELYQELDDVLLSGLAQRALSSSSEYVREVGTDFSRSA